MIVVVGLGPVGSATASELHECGQDVVGVDICEERRRTKRYRTLTTIPNEADIVIVATHEKDLATVAADIHSESWVIVRSTTTPGMVGRLFGPEATYVPETRTELGLQFPPRFGLVGSCLVTRANAAEKLLFYSNTPVFHGSVEDVEKTKLALNAWHGLKVAFVNELERTLGIEATNLALQAFFREPQGEYMIPGKPYGGKCLPKDIQRLAEWVGLQGVILNAIQKSNDLGG